MNNTIWNTFFWIPLMVVNHLYCYQQLFSVMSGKEGWCFEPQINCDFKRVILTVEWIFAVSFCPSSNNSPLFQLLISSPTLAPCILDKTKIPWGSTWPRMKPKATVHSPGLRGGFTVGMQSKSQDLSRSYQKWCSLLLIDFSLKGCYSHFCHHAGKACPRTEPTQRKQGPRDRETK